MNNNFKEMDFNNFLLSCKKNVLKMAQNGGCFIGSAFSCIDILAYLYSNIFDIEKIKNMEKDRDILILSKGHAVAGLYAVLAQVGIISKDRLKNYLTVKDALTNPSISKSTKNNEITRQSSEVIERLKHIPPGGNAWHDGIPDHLKLNVKGTKLSNIYRRLKIDEPSYTITGSGGGGTHVYHFKEDRALTNRERARLQTFPDKYEFEGGKESIRRQIGMAVPVEGAKKIIKAVKNALKKRKKHISYHHDWMIKANEDELYFTGKENLNQHSFYFEEIN